ncbi:hypothetical protein K492DRAFT_175538 [Lichtheimia hyalospora FSU 10163]|nr:hypothetical protein K492DRAFT_175538 [Lichtheimia hyalospora FSU 10163]
MAVESHAFMPPLDVETFGRLAQILAHQTIWLSASYQMHVVADSNFFKCNTVRS